MAVSEHGLSRNDIHGKNSFNQLPGPAVSLTALIGMPLKTACPQGVALAQNGFNQLPVPAVYLSPSPRRENCARKLTVPCGQSASVPVPGALPGASRGRSWLLVVGEWQVLLRPRCHGFADLRGDLRENGVPVPRASPWRRRASQRIFLKRCSATKNSGESFAKVNRLEFQKLARVAGKIVSDSNAFAYGLRIGSSARLPQLKNCFC
jgi:hypothetical protein